MPLPQHFHIPPAGSPDPSFTCEGEYWRIQVLSDALIRVEWSPSGQWEDRPTQIVVNRRGEAPCECRIERDVCGAGSIRITTAAMSLTYDGNEFSPHGLYAQVRNEAQWGGVWRWDVNEEHPWLYGHNMGGTTRTLDTVDGACDVDPGIIDGRGIVALNDPSAALTPEGWVAPREEGSRDVYIFAHGHRFDEALRDFYRLTGAQPVIPRYALGNWWSRYHAYTAAEYQQVMDDFDAHDIPLAVAVIDMDWHLTDIPARYGSGWTGYTWNRELFPDPEAFLAHLHDRGLHVTLNLHPADGIRGHEEAYAALARRLGHNTSDDAPIPFDVTNPDFMTAYFEEVLDPLEQQGVDFWWVDWQQGEYASIPGIDPLWILNHMHVLDHAHRNGGRGPAPPHPPDVLRGSRPRGRLDASLVLHARTQPSDRPHHVPLRPHLAARTRASLASRRTVDGHFHRTDLSGRTQHPRPPYPERYSRFRPLGNRPPAGGDFFCGRGGARESTPPSRGD